MLIENYIIKILSYKLWMLTISYQIICMSKKKVGKKQHKQQPLWKKEELLKSAVPLISTGSSNSQSP